MSAGREFQVDGAATEKARRASSVCTRGTTSSTRILSADYAVARCLSVCPSVLHTQVETVKHIVKLFTVR